MKIHVSSIGLSVLSLWSSSDTSVADYKNYIRYFTLYLSLLIMVNISEHCVSSLQGYWKILYGFIYASVLDLFLIFFVLCHIYSEIGYFLYYISVKNKIWYIYYINITKINAGVKDMPSIFGEVIQYAPIQKLDAFGIRCRLIANIIPLPSLILQPNLLSQFCSHSRR